MMETTETTVDNSRLPTHFAYQVTQAIRGSFWDKVGFAWQNENSIVVQLKSFPINGRIVLRPVLAKE